LRMPTSRTDDGPPLPSHTRAPRISTSNIARA
jgi:hypothetical protein